MLSGLPEWLQSSLLNWVDLGKKSARLLSEKCEWECKFDAIFDADRSELKTIGRSGIPSELRKKIWAKILQIERVPDHFKDYEGSLLAFFGTSSAKHFPALPDNLINLDRLHLAEEQRDLIKGIMYILGSTYPIVENTTFLLAFVSVLSAAHLAPNQILGCMASVIKAHSDAAKGHGDWAYFPVTRREGLIFERVFKLLVKKFEPDIYTHIKRIYKIFPGKEIDLKSFLQGLFIEVYPRKVVKRIMDAFLIEGHKILFRIFLAHLNMRKQKILSSKTFEELNKAVTEPEHGHSKEIIEALFPRAFRYGLSRGKIFTLRAKAKRSAFEDIEEDDDRTMLVLQRPLPKLTIPSEILTEADWVLLWSWIPARLRPLDLDMVFSTSQHGYSLKTLYSKADMYDCLIMLIETEDGQVIGTFSTKSLSHRNLTFFGNGETFIFTLKPGASRYDWVPASGSNCFILGSNNFLAFGAGTQGYGVKIHAGLEFVESNATETFGNPSLLSDCRATNIVAIEIFAFV